jgi:hypothetical protein
VREPNISNFVIGSFLGFASASKEVKSREVEGDSAILIQISEIGST